MARSAAIFVTFCMVVIAACLGGVLYLYFKLSGAESTLIALITLTGMALYNTVSTRLRDRSDMGEQIADLSRESADLARQMAEIKRQLDAVEGKADTAVNRARAAIEPLAAEIGELGNLVTQLAETVATHDAVLESRVMADTPVTDAASPPGSEQAEAPEAKANGAAVTQVKDMDRNGMVGMIREAVEASRIDTYLQPIVTLPQRKVRYYEATSRLRTASGEQVLATAFLPHAESAGLMPKIDNLLLFRCVQVLRRLQLKNRDVGLFCNISGTTLSDPEFFPQFAEFMDANRALAPSLVFEFTQATVRNMGPMEHESLAALAERGFRFCVDHVTDLRMELRDLSERGFRFIKVPGALLLSHGGGSADIHPADLADLLARSGIELIAERIESESAVVDLLDYDVKYGQGFLFSQPRPVRPDALQGSAERTAMDARDKAGEPQGIQRQGAVA
jgi:cyclic-di-GMP phosphodiesterase TipF (flagellum assembly factor)